VVNVAPRGDSTVVSRLLLPVERGKVQEFSRAVHSSHPARHDVDHARSAGFVDVVAPPTFTVVAAHYDPEGKNANARALAHLDVDPRYVLLGGFAWSYQRPVTAGMVLEATSRVAEVQHVEGRRAGAMTRIAVATVFAERGTGREVVRSTASLLHAPAMFAEEGSTSDA
jgi:hypothetical protein